MYALASLLGVLAVWAARRYGSAAGRCDGAVYVLAAAAGLYTLYLFAPIWVAINVAWLWVWRGATNRRRELLRWAGLQLLVAALVPAVDGVRRGGLPEHGRGHAHPPARFSPHLLDGADRRHPGRRGPVQPADAAGAGDVPGRSLAAVLAPAS